MPVQKVKRISRPRDWSDELDEDDILLNFARPRSVQRGLINWAEGPEDIGQLWHFIEDDGVP